MKLFKLAQLQASTGTEKIAVSPNAMQMFWGCVEHTSVWQCYSPVYLLGHLKVSWPTVSSGQLAEKSAETAAASFTSHSNLEQNKKPFTLQKSYFHVQTMTFFWKMSEEFSCPLLSWARRNETFCFICHLYVVWTARSCVHVWKSWAFNAIFYGFLEKEIRRSPEGYGIFLSPQKRDGDKSLKGWKTSLKSGVVYLFFVASVFESEDVRMQGRVDIIKFVGGKLEGEILFKKQLVMYQFPYQTLQRMVEFKQYFQLFLFQNNHSMSLHLHATE